MGRLALTLPLVAALAAIPTAPGAAFAQGLPSPCLGDLTAGGVVRKPAPPLRFGITPAGEAGAIGSAPLTPISRKETLAALDRLRPDHAPFTLRLNRLFWSQGRRGLRHFVHLADRYTRRGYRVELQLRYHPRPEQEGDIGAWRRFVRRVVLRFGPNPKVSGLQVANEVNFYPIAPDASDSSYDRARDALIRGVETARRVADERGFDQLQIGFNWAYRTDPLNESSFWRYLRDHGGKRFVRSVDWVGLDAYPGTVFPPLEPPLGTGFRDGMVNAMSQLRECFMPIARLGPETPIHVGENGWPTGLGRSEDEQAAALRQMVGAVSDFRGTYHVTDYRWFDLRDHNTSSINFQHHYGLLKDDYAPKPAFGVYRRLVQELSG